MNSCTSTKPVLAWFSRQSEVALSPLNKNGIQKIEQAMRIHLMHATMLDLREPPKDESENRVFEDLRPVLVWPLLTKTLDSVFSKPSPIPAFNRIFKILYRTDPRNDWMLVLRENRDPVLFNKIQTGIYDNFDALFAEKNASDLIWWIASDSHGWPDWTQKLTDWIVNKLQSISDHLSRDVLRSPDYQAILACDRALRGYQNFAGGVFRQHFFYKAGIDSPTIDKYQQIIFPDTRDAARSRLIDERFSDAYYAKLARD